METPCVHDRAAKKWHHPLHLKRPERKSTQEKFCKPHPPLHLISSTITAGAISCLMQIRELRSTQLSCQRAMGSVKMKLGVKRVLCCGLCPGLNHNQDILHLGDKRKKKCKIEQLQLNNVSGCGVVRIPTTLLSQ